MGELLTVYASIGNSDDKLAQWRWAQFFRAFSLTVNRFENHRHGTWRSDSVDAYQNACICFEIDAEAAPKLRAELAELAEQYEQDSIAWAVAPETEFIAPPADQPRREPRAAQYPVGGLGPAPTAFDTEARTIAETQAARDGS